MAKRWTSRALRPPAGHAPRPPPWLDLRPGRRGVGHAQRFGSHRRNSGKASTPPSPARPFRPPPWRREPGARPRGSRPSPLPRRREREEECCDQTLRWTGSGSSRSASFRLTTSLFGSSLVPALSRRECCMPRPRRTGGDEERERGGAGGRGGVPWTGRQRRGSSRPSSRTLTRPSGRRPWRDCAACTPRRRGALWPPRARGSHRWRPGPRAQTIGGLGGRP